MEIYSTRIYLLMHDLCITNSMGIFGIFGIEKDRRGRGEDCDRDQKEDIVN